MGWLLFFLISGAGGGFSVWWLSHHPGSLEIQWLDYHIQTSVAFFLGFCLLFHIFIFLLIKGIKILFNLPSRLRHRYQAYDHSRAFKSLLKALINFHQNEDESSVLEALKGPLKVSDTRPFALFLAAQTMQRQGHISEAQRYYRDLTRLPLGEILGLQGLIDLNQQQGKELHAFEDAQQALPYITKAPKLARTIFKIFLENGSEKEIKETLTHIQNAKLLSANEIKYLKSEFASFLYQSAMHKNDHREALLQAKISYQSHMSLKTGLHYCEQLDFFKEYKKARKVIEELWAHHPDSELISLYIKIKAHETTGKLSHYQMIETLTNQNPDHFESLYARAHGAMQDHLWGIALENLEKLSLHHSKDPQFLLLKADYEQQAHGDSQAAIQWLKEGITQQTK